MRFTSSLLDIMPQQWNRFVGLGKLLSSAVVVVVSEHDFGFNGLNEGRTDGWTPSFNTPSHWVWKLVIFLPGVGSCK